MENSVDLSIVVVTRNRATKLSECIAHIVNVSTSHTFELIIADNASTDETRKIVEALAARDRRIKYVFVQQIGSGAAKDSSWRQTRGEIVAFTDDDCYVAVTYVDAIVAAFRNNPKAGCIGGRILLHNPLDAPVTIDLREFPINIKPYRFIQGGEIQGANFAFRRTTLDDIDGFDTMLGAGTKFPNEDIDAVAAALWAGYEVDFDPNIVVSHDHGRRGDAVKRLGRSYDYGRGAYYAKFILRPDTRSAYVRRWKELAIEDLSTRRLRSFTTRAREAYSAVRYLWIKRQFHFLACFITRLFIYLPRLLYSLVLEKHNNRAEYR